MSAARTRPPGFWSRASSIPEAWAWALLLLLAPLCALVLFWIPRPVEPEEMPGLRLSAAEVSRVLRRDQAAQSASLPGEELSRLERLYLEQGRYERAAVPPPEAGPRLNELRERLRRFLQQQGEEAMLALRARAVERNRPHEVRDRRHGVEVDISQALAKGARAGGAQVFQDTKVNTILKDGRKVTGVSTDKGDIRAKYVVICAGMWSREVAASIGVNLPLHACEHYYVFFESVAGLRPDLPVLRDYDACTYYKYDAGKLLVGAFEPTAKPWGMDGIAEDFCFDEIAGDFDHFEPVLHDAMHRMPALQEAGIQKFFCGPESFTPDVRYHIGRAPELDNCFVSAGLNSIGLQSAGGIGKVMAEWIRDGHPPVDLWEVDVRRNMPFQGNRKYLQERVSESLGLLYATHFPFRQYETSRGVRKSAIHDRLVAAGACHGEAFGWERPNWYAPKGVEAKYEYSYGRQNWFEHSAAEHRAVREKVAMFDQSSFAKFRLEGRDAVAVLNRVCANNVDVRPGRIVYTQWLNERGGIEADLTVTRLDEDVFLVVGAAETETRDFHYLKQHIPADARAVLTNVSSGMGVISIMGPSSRELLQALTPADMSHDAFAFATSREIEMGYGLVRASRITFVGELGWELYIPTEFITSSRHKVDVFVSCAIIISIA